MGKIIDDRYELEKLSIVKKYFSRIFTIFKPEIRNRLNSLNIPEKQKKKIRRELAFLTLEKQKEYLDEIYEISNRSDD